tara:strand:+ start:429 stop:1253 length:825 start_codon:yes stop_codon:yes gene_type:complete
MDDTLYRGYRYFSQSVGKKGLDGNWRKAFATELTRTAALVLGSLIHFVTLIPSQVQKYFAIGPNTDRRSKSGKEAWAEFELTLNGRQVVTEAQMEIAENCRDAVLRHPSARNLFDKSQKEVSYFWYDDESRLPMKARLDLVAPKLVADLKSCADASPEGFGLQAARLHYGLQAAQYLDAVEATTGTRPDAFLFLCVETQEPFSTGLWYVEDGDDLVEAGKILLRKSKLSLRRWLDTAPNERMEFYGDGKAQKLECPPWYYRRIYENSVTKEIAR